MKVLFVSHAYQIPENQEKLAALTGLGCEIGLCAPAVWREPGVFMGRNFPLSQHLAAVRYFPLPVWRSGHLASYLFPPGSMARAARSFRPEIVHIEQEAYSFVAAQACIELWRSPARITLFSWENLDRRLHPLQRAARRISFRRLDGIVAGNQDAMDLACRRGFEGPVSVSAQFGIYRAYEEHRAARAPDEFVIGFVGRLDHEKGGDVLIDAMAHLARVGKRFRARFVGAGPMGEAWKRRAEEAGIAGRVSWHDVVPHARIPALMSECSVIVLPSRRSGSWAEQFGQVLVQAMSLGIPAIGAISGAIPEVIGRRDVLFPENDSLALSGILGRLMDDPAFFAEMRGYARKRVADEFTMEKIARNFTGFWRTLG